MKLLRAVLFLLPVALPLTAADLFLVRHAEKVADGSSDPGLTAVGKQRAVNLAGLLRSAGIERIFSSDYRRTLETARPLAAALGLEIEVYDPRDLEGLAGRLLALEQNALVVGHSDTTPDLVALIGGDAGEPIVEAWEYDRVYLVQTDGGRVVRTLLLHLPPHTEERAP